MVFKHLPLFFLFFPSSIYPFEATGHQLLESRPTFDRAKRSARGCWSTAAGGPFFLAASSLVSLLVAMICPLGPGVARETGPVYIPLVGEILVFVLRSLAAIGIGIAAGRAVAAR